MRIGMTRLQDDFYDAINGEWAKTAEIPADKPSTGGFNDLAVGIENWLLSTTNEWQHGENIPKDDILQQFIAYHRLTADTQTRDKIGVAPVMPLLAQYKGYQSFADFASHIAELEQKGLPNALPFGIEPDFKNAKLNVLWAGSLPLLLPDTTYYTPDNDQAKVLLAKFREQQMTLLPQFGFSSDETEAMIDNYIALDARIASVSLSREEQNKYAKLYHPYQWENFVEQASELPLNDIIKSLIGQIPDEIIVPAERFWASANQFYSEDAWPLLKDYLLINVANEYTDLLSDDLRVLGGAYARALQGLPEAKSTEKAAFYLAEVSFSQAIGMYYAHEKFSPEAKADVESKVATMIDVYKNRLQNVTWLTQATRDKAIIKLNAIVPHIGYPDKLPDRLAQKTVDEGATLFESAAKFRQIEIAHAWQQWHQPVDENEWQMPAHLVNAYYDPQQNQIFFPAAILQAPFYSLNQSSSANYGGIGAVIAHEISHAFDTNGASFDEFGSLNNWWTDADYAAFKERTQQVVDQFDGLDSYGAKVNGKLTVSENVADLGGLAAALAAAKRDEDFSSEAFFTNWAAIWRMKARPEYMQLLAAMDPHGPAKARVNVQLKNFDDFFTTFDVKETDGMWLAPDKRVQIW